MTTLTAAQISCARAAQVRKRKSAREVLEQACAAGIARACSKVK
jgi:hypothetical protein